ncbi:MAG: T9SS type A sorting domain-containing protein [Bacteroidia bacterium]|nr:T9SS type A sorting domain-containing protein [Bacteroidia bacterium]
MIYRIKVLLCYFFTLALIFSLPYSLKAQSDYKLAEQDSLALVAFYWATDGPNWLSNQPGFGFNDLSSEWQGKYDGQFNPWFSGPAKDWFGVKVEKRAIPNSNDSTYRVTWLWPVIGRRTDGQNLLNGYIPREIGLLTALEQFRVNGNDGFRWELVPDELYLPSLQWLDVEACWFGGGVSDELRNCGQILKMNLRYNYFDYIPNWDFLDEQALRNLNGTQWLYNSRFSYAILEQIIDYFYTISPNPQEFGVEMRDMFDVGDEREIVAPLGSSVDIVCNDAGNQDAFISYQWFKGGLSRFGRTQKTYSIPSVSANDYGNYKVRISNDYVKTYDQNTNYGEVFTKEIHLVEQPVPPVIEKGISSNNGQSLRLFFSKPMSNSALIEYQNLSVMAGTNNLNILSATIKGRLEKQVVLELDSPIKNGDLIDLSYTGSGNIADHNGGLLQAFTGFEVENRVRLAPIITSAATSLDGSGIEVYFDQFIDENSFSGANFKVFGDSLLGISAISLLPGEIDRHISKTVFLNLTEPLLDTAASLNIQYLSGEIAGLYGGTLESSDTIAIENRVSIERETITFIFEDGSESLDNILLSGSWKVDPIQMYDDGTHADAIANDHIWTHVTQLVEDDYSWDIISREEIMRFDTVETVDPNTGVVTLVITPISINEDSILSGNILLELSVKPGEVLGDTLYGIQNRDVIFRLRTQGASENVFLMGIEADWSNGRLMSAIDPGNLYADTLIKMTAGDLISYNYRIGEDWENLTPDPREYTVKNGENLIQDEFGVFTDINEPAPPPLSIFPNPSLDGFIRISGLEEVVDLEIYDLNGRMIKGQTNLREHEITLDLSSQAAGLYVVKIKTNRGFVYTYKFLLR